MSLQRLCTVHLHHHTNFCISAVCVRSWSRAIQGPWWRSTLHALTSCPSLTSCWVTLGNPTRGLALRSALSVSSARHAPTPRWRTGSEGIYEHPHAEIQQPLPSSPRQAKKPVFFFCYQEYRRRRAPHPYPTPLPHPQPCHESADQGKLLLALVGPDSHDFELQVVMAVTSGKRTFDAVADSGALSATERGSTHPEPYPPLSSHLPQCLPLWVLQVLLWIQPQRCLCAESQNTQGATKKVLFDKTVIIIIIILYNIVPFRIHS